MQVSRQQIVNVARSYIGTPFGHQGRVRGNALDCVGLPLMIAEELNLKDKLGKLLTGQSYDIYSPQPLGNFVYDTCYKHLIYTPIRKMNIGDIVCIKMMTYACHVAIVSEITPEVTKIIHAYDGGTKKCVEHALDERWKKRIVACFSFPGVD